MMTSLHVATKSKDTALPLPFGVVCCVQIESPGGTTLAL